MKKFLVTCALPYANGPLHIGHMLEHIQADIWVRYQRMIGNIVYFICADDAHGTAIMINAKNLDINPEQLIDKVYNSHKRDLINFNISYDNYHSTHSKECYELLYIIYDRLKKTNNIKYKYIKQLYDLQNNMYLPDRLVKGTCPKCLVSDQYGDNCEKCGAIYYAFELINPKSTLSNTIPIIKKSKHIFFNLPKFKHMLYEWIHSGSLQTHVANKVQEWFKNGLEPWNISRDAPYFGFKIPNTKNKYFYVWLDATIGYISTFKNLCNKNNNIKFEEYWNEKSDTNLIHFIGKDIIYFHSLFWPAILHAINFRKPTKLFVHGYVTVNGYKMSKSRGTFITANSYLKYLDTDCLRYYYATKLSDNINDIDINFDDFIKRVNSDIVNKIVNIAMRNVTFINKFFNNTLSDIVCSPEIYNNFVNTSDIISKAFHQRKFSHVIREILLLSDIANRYTTEHTPWNIINVHSKKKELHDICSMGIQLFRILMIYLKPILPSLAKRVEYFLNTSLTWESISVPLIKHKINSCKILFERVNKKQVTDMINE